MTNEYDIEDCPEALALNEDYIDGHYEGDMKVLANYALDTPDAIEIEIYRDGDEPEDWERIYIPLSTARALLSTLEMSIGLYDYHVNDMD